MLIRLSQWGLVLLAASSLASAASARAQDSNSVVVPAPAPVAEPLPPGTVAPAPVPGSQPNALQRERELEDRSIARSRRERPVKTQEADPWKKNPPVWSIRDDSKTKHPYAINSQPAPGIGHYPGGPTGQWGVPYYYSRTSPDTAYGQVGGVAGVIDDGSGPGAPIPGDDFHGHGDHSHGFDGGGSYGNCGVDGGLPGSIGPMPAPGTYGPGYGQGAYGHGEYDAGAYAAGPHGADDHGPDADYAGPGYGPGPQGPGYGPQYAQGYGAVGYGAAGYGGGPGPGRAAVPGQLPGDPYLFHFGPGYYRTQEAGHYSFPYYSYRRPWYFPGHPSYNRDTNVPW